MCWMFSWKFVAHKASVGLHFLYDIKLKHYSGGVGEDSISNWYMVYVVRNAEGNMFGGG